MKKKAFITGINGQDGSYLTELLIKKNYEVHGTIRKSSTFNTERIDSIISSKHYNKDFFLYYTDLIDAHGIYNLINKIKPDEIYNLAAQSHVHTSFDLPEYTTQINSLGTLKILDAVRNLKLKTRIYQASTSELYGNTKVKIQNEKTPFEPRSPYAISKLYSFWIAKNYRESHNIFLSNGILFNHESPRRNETFVTKKITSGAVKIKLDIQNKISLGNIYAKRDWGYAPEYVYGMWKILQHNEPDDFVIATGKSYSVKEFIEKTFKYLDINIVWKGKGYNEKAYNKKNNKVIVDIDRKYFRNTEVNFLKGSTSKIKKKLNWYPKTSLDEIIKIMVDSDLIKYSN